jgi:hypothetical protein
LLLLLPLLLPPDKLDRLTRRAQELTKADLAQVDEHKTPPETLNLSVKDLQSLSDVFDYRPEPIGKPRQEIEISPVVAPCCCCCADATSEFDST